jgi:hypothetical protein
MNNNDELSVESDQVALKDTAGLAEIEEAIREIERIRNGGAPKEEEQEEEEENQEDQQEEEETEESENQEEQEEEEQAPEVKEAPIGTKKLDKIWKIKRSRYKALAEKKLVEEENARLKEMLAESLNSGTYHYEKNVYAELEKAKDLKRRAIEEGDVDASIEADISLNKAINSINELEKWTTSERKQSVKQQEFRKPEADYDEIEREKAADWLEDYPQLQPTSRQYNPPLANKVSQFINYLDEEIESRGQGHLRFSEEYFGAIDRHIEEINNKERTEKKRKSLDSVNVGGVRNSYGNANGKSSKNIQMTLTADEKRICANGGISEKDWLRYKLEDLKQGNQ